MDLKIKNDIDNFWNKKNELNFSDPSIKKTIMQVLENLDSGSIRVCEKKKWDLGNKRMDKKGYTTFV